MTQLRQKGPPRPAADRTLATSSAFSMKAHSPPAFVTQKRSMSSPRPSEP